MIGEQYDRLITKLKRELGVTIVDALNDSSVIEIMLNPDSCLWVERFGVGKQCVSTINASQASSIISTVAAMLDTTCGYDNPRLEGELPLDQSRFSALVPPVVARPSFTIRRKATKVFTLDDYVASGIMSESQRDLIVSLVTNKKNIMVAGGTGSGKTTLLNAIIHSMAHCTPHDRLVIIEDTGELQCSSKDFVTMRATAAFSMNDCLKSSMRFRPDRIIVGEVRGGEGMALLKSWNTGHEGGAGTVHANSATLALSRLQSLIAEAEEAANYTPQMIRSLLGEAIDAVVFITKCPNSPAGRTIKEVLRVHSFDEQANQFLTENLIS